MILSKKRLRKEIYLNTRGNTEEKNLRDSSSFIPLIDFHWKSSAKTRKEVEMVDGNRSNQSSMRSNW